MNVSFLDFKVGNAIRTPNGSIQIENEPSRRQINKTIERTPLSVYIFQMHNNNNNNLRMSLSTLTQSAESIFSFLFS